MKIFTPNKPCPKHLQKVKEDVLKYGIPVIRVVQRGDEYIAIEGSHRCAACKELGIVPKIQVISESEYLEDGGVSGDIPLATAGWIADIFSEGEQGYFEF